jgi:hypothetical protein
MMKSTLALLATASMLGASSLPPALPAREERYRVQWGSLCPRCGKPGVKRTSALSYHTACGYLGDAT